MSPAHDLVNRHVAAFNARDVDALLDDFAPSADWVTGDYTVPGGNCENSSPRRWSRSRHASVSSG